MEIRQLRYFLKVSDELHFRRAADLLHVSQPSLSQQIHDLEEELGAQLFTRSNRKVELTEAGRALACRGRQIVQQLDSAVQEVRDVNRGYAGRITVGFISTALVGALPPIVRCFQAKYPSVELQLHESEPDRQIENLIRGDLDIGFMHARIHGQPLASMVVRRERIAVALPTRLDTKGPVNLRTLENETSIMPAPFQMHGFSEHIDLAYKLADARPQRLLYTRLIIIAVHLVAAGLGIAVVPASFASAQIKGVVYRPLQFEPPAVELTAVWRRDDQSILLKRFVETMKFSKRSICPDVESV